MHVSSMVSVQGSARRPILKFVMAGFCAFAACAQRYAGSVTRNPKSVISLRLANVRTRLVNAAGTFCAAMRRTPKPGLLGVDELAEIETLTRSSRDMLGA